MRNYLAIMPKIFASTPSPRAQMIDNLLTFTLLQKNGLRNIILVLVYPLGWEAHFRKIADCTRSWFDQTLLSDCFLTLMLFRWFFRGTIVLKYIKKALICDQAQLSGLLQSRDISSWSWSSQSLMRQILSLRTRFCSIPNFDPWTFIFITLEPDELQQPA